MNRISRIAVPAVALLLLASLALPAALGMGGVAPAIVVLPIATAAPDPGAFTPVLPGASFKVVAPTPTGTSARPRCKRRPLQPRPLRRSSSRLFLRFRSGHAAMYFG